MAALDDRRAELLLELADRRRQRRLRDVAGLGRAAEMLLAGERHEIFELPDHHGASLTGPCASRAPLLAPSRHGGGLWQAAGAPGSAMPQAAARRFSEPRLHRPSSRRRRWRSSPRRPVARASISRPSRSGAAADRRTVRVADGRRQDGHRQRPHRPSDARLFRLHALPRHLPDDAGANLRRARATAGQAGQGAVHHRRSRARHAEADGRLRLELRSSASSAFPARRRRSSKSERAYRVYAKKAPGKNGDYAMDHSSVVYLMDRNGRFVEAFNLERSAADAAKELESYL